MSAPEPVRRTVLGGFTLLEVMVAVAILSLALVAIFSSEAGAIRAGARARAMTTATLLARCKMGEVEEQIAKEGFPAIRDEGSDGCCEGSEVEGYSCEWSITRVELDGALGADDTLGGILEPEGEGDSVGTPPPAGPAATTSDALAGGGSADMIGGLALQFAFPVLAPAIGEQVRRAEVTVRWREGGAESDFTVVQYLVADQGADIDELLQGQQPGAPQAGQQNQGSTATGTAVQNVQNSPLQLPGIRR